MSLLSHSPSLTPILSKTLKAPNPACGAQKHSADHFSGCRASRYLELQEVWEQVGATSVLSIPIPAVRHYESASIIEAPPAVEEPASDPACHMSHVLHNSNGAIGVVTVGLATEKIDLNGRFVSENVQLVLKINTVNMRRQETSQLASCCMPSCSHPFPSSSCPSLCCDLPCCDLPCT